MNISNAYKSPKYFRNLYHFDENFKYLRIFVLVTAQKKKKLILSKTSLCIIGIWDGDNKYEYQSLL